MVLTKARFLRGMPELYTRWEKIRKDLSDLFFFRFLFSQYSPKPMARFWEEPLLSLKRGLCEHYLKLGCTSLNLRYNTTQNLK